MKFLRPTYSMDIMTIEHASHGISLRRTTLVFFAPASHISHCLAFMQAEDIDLVHGRTERFNLENLRAFAQLACWLKPVIDEL